MGDFHQNGSIATLHNLHYATLDYLEKELMKFSRYRRMGLIIPTLYSDMEQPAFQNIVNVVKDIPYISEIIVGLDKADPGQYQNAKKYLSILNTEKCRCRIIWNDGPRMTELRYLLEEKKIYSGDPGKGRNVWFCFGYLIASGRSEAIALHDADIITYNRDMLARLFYPVADPNFEYKFCKGYYFRSDGEKLNGRVTRLMVTPLIRSLKRVFPANDYLDFLDHFRYILAGEFSMRAEIMKTVRIPNDWGLEIGILSEIRRNNALNKICQVEIADSYDHKHQPESYDDPNAGLSKMSFDIARNIYSKLATEGAVFNQGVFRTIKAIYLRVALEMVEQYNADSVINGLKMERDKEERMVDLFGQTIYRAGVKFLEFPDLLPVIPSWNRVMDAIPNVLDIFNDLVENDNKM
jgi:glucosyl-3-phosphoglycerate synthase